MKTDLHIGAVVDKTQEVSDNFRAILGHFDDSLQWSSLWRDISTSIASGRGSWTIRDHFWGCRVCTEVLTLLPRTGKSGVEKGRDGADDPVREAAEKMGAKSIIMAPGEARGIAP